MNEIKRRILEVFDTYSRIKAGYIPLEDRDELAEEICHAVFVGTEENGTIPFRRAEPQLWSVDEILDYYMGKRMWEKEE